MASLCLSSSWMVSLHHQKPLLSFKLRSRPSNGIGHATGAVSFNPLRLLADLHGTAKVMMKVEKRRKRGSSLVCYAAPVSVHSLQWVSAISCIALILAKGTGIHKSVVVPLFALHAPSSIVAWIKGEYGVWTAFIALIARLFFTFPGELELPFIALLLVTVAPHQVMSIRGKQEGAIISLAISCFLAFQHFSQAGSLQKAYEKSSVLATVAIIGVTVVSLLFLMLSSDRQRTASVSAKKRIECVVCYAAPMLSVHNLQWISSISCVGTGIHKSFVVPLFALQAPLVIISWMKGDYGIWAAVLTLLTRLFFSFPGELELPFIALILVFVALFAANR